MQADPAARAPPPPRPVHPATLALRQAAWAKLTAGVDRLAQSLGPEHENLASLQGDLLQGEPALADELARLQAVSSVCSGVASRYHTSIASAEGKLADLERRGEIHPDEMVCSTTVLFNQCVAVTFRSTARLILLPVDSLSSTLRTALSKMSCITSGEH